MKFLGLLKILQLALALNPLGCLGKNGERFSRSVYFLGMNGSEHGVRCSLVD